MCQTFCIYIFHFVISSLNRANIYSSNSVDKNIFLVYVSEMNNRLKMIIFPLLWLVLFLGALYLAYSYNLFTQNPSSDLGIFKDPTNGKIYATVITPYNTNSSFKENPQNEPIKISIPKISVDAKVNNPESTNIETLNQSLLSGTVHYPGSGSLLSNSNILIFGHSSHLAVIVNQSYKIFNRLNELQTGDLVYLESNNEQNTYQVKSVSHVNSEDTQVDFSSKTKKLTLVSCDNFGQKQDRYVVEADFVSTLSKTN